MDVERNPQDPVSGGHPAQQTVDGHGNPQDDGNQQNDRLMQALSTQLPPLNRIRPPPLSMALLENSDDLPQDPHYLRMYLRGCSHDLVTIKYCATDNDICHKCLRRPIRGWLYRCAGDSYDAECDSVDESFLSPSITKAIADGHYTDDEIEALHLQKLEVREDAEALRDEAPSTPSRNSSDDFGHHSDDSNQPQVGFIEDINMDDLPKPPVRTVDMPKRKPRRASCDFQACARCHWRFSESAMVSIDQVCDDPKIKPPTVEDLAGAPISNSKVVSNLLVKRPAYTMFRDDHGRFYSQEVRKTGRGPVKKLSLAELWKMDKMLAFHYQHTLGRQMLQEPCPGPRDGRGSAPDSELEEGQIREDWRREYRVREDLLKR